MKMAEKASTEIARDRIRLDLAARGIQREDQKARLDVLKLTGYEERIRDFDTETQRVFFRVQDLEAQEDVQQRAAIEPSHSAYRYELGDRAAGRAGRVLPVFLNAPARPSATHSSFTRRRRMRGGAAPRPL